LRVARATLDKLGDAKRSVRGPRGLPDQPAAPVLKTGRHLSAGDHLWTARQGVLAITPSG